MSAEFVAHMFVAHMEEVLELYAEPYDPQRPVVCFYETTTQLLAKTRAPLPAGPGRPRREDYEYVRAGTRNLFLACGPRRDGATWPSPSDEPWRTSPSKCAGWWTRPTPTYQWSAWCWTT